MLRNIVEDYIKSIKEERDFDVPFLGLLWALGFSDRRLVHGRLELGRDFIAKRTEDGVRLQYGFQTKAGNVDTTAWRTIQGQIIEAATTALPHQDFDSSLPRKTVLVATGTVNADVALRIKQMNEGELRNVGEIYFWDHPRLIEFFMGVDPSAIYPLGSQGYLDFANFFITYGKAMAGKLDERELEAHSRNWTRNAGKKDALAAAALEAFSIKQQCVGSGNSYLGIVSMLAIWRAVMVAAYAAVPAAESYFADLMLAAQRSVVIAAHQYVDHVLSLVEKAGGKLAQAIIPPGAFVVYRQVAVRMVEALSLIWFLDEDEKERLKAAAALQHLTVTEKGSREPPSDRHAVSIVAGVRALVSAGKLDHAADYLKEVARWVFAQIDTRLGMASLEDSDEQALELMLGKEFPELKTKPRKSSFCLTAMMDSAALVGDSRLFQEISSDILAVGGHPEYFLVGDSEGQFFFSHDDVKRIPDAQADPDRSIKEHIANAPHMRNEPSAFSIADRYGYGALLGLSLLLRDRYFPKAFLSGH